MICVACAISSNPGSRDRHHTRLVAALERSGASMPDRTLRRQQSSSNSRDLMPQRQIAR
ncbi:uncharacterized protein G2W53_039124 [Senna tora]|uniref:Uncharacterized protein n=1 Tax=Senna tora TaxID=362788 RepID=A0A834SM83_9FABA|nr:uncharacterized protein G2W53_039124 [Senna tora]